MSQAPFADLAPSRGLSRLVPRVLALLLGLICAGAQPAFASHAQDEPRPCLTDTPGFNPRGIPTSVVGFDSPYRCGYGFVSPPRHSSADTDFGPSTIRQTEPNAARASTNGQTPAPTTTPAGAAPPNPTVLRAAVLAFPPYAEQDANGEWTGESVELFRATARDIGCTTTFITMSSPEIVRAFEREEIDAVALPLSPNPLVRGVVTLTPSFETSTLRIAVYRDRLADDLTILLESLFTPRQLRVYAIMTGLVVVFAVLIWLLERSKNQHFRGKRHEGFGSGLWWSITTLSTVGYGDKVPVSAAGRLFAGTWMVLSLLLVAIFTATVTSSITAHDSSIEVEGVHDLSRARLGIVENGLASGYVNDHFLPHVSYPSLLLAIDELLAGRLDAVLADEHGLQRAMGPGNERRIVLLEQHVERMPVSFGLRKTLPRDFIRRFDEVLIARLRSMPEPQPPAAATQAGPSTEASDPPTAATSGTQP